MVFCSIEEHESYYILLSPSIKVGGDRAQQTPTKSGSVGARAARRVARPRPVSLVFVRCRHKITPRVPSSRSTAGRGSLFASHWGSHRTGTRNSTRASEHCVMDGVRRLTRLESSDRAAPDQPQSCITYSRACFSSNPRDPTPSNLGRERRLEDRGLRGARARTRVVVNR